MNTLLPATTSFNFTAASLDSRITFARSGNTATATNSAGRVVAVNANLPRFDYNPVTLACRGLLIEESRTNLLTHSSAFNESAWTKTGATITQDSVASPDGTSNADSLVENTATSTHQVFQILGTAAAHSFSVYLKAASRSWVALRVSVTGPVVSYGYFNLSTGVIGSVAAGLTASITPAGDGWYRCTISGTLAAGAPVLIAAATADGTITYTGNGLTALYLWGAQLEAGAFVTSYIPTSTTALTRNADVVTITGTGFSDWWQDGKGSALVKAQPGTVSGTRPWVQFDDATADNIIALRGNTTNPELYIRAGGSDQAQIDAGTIAANASYRLAGAWATDSCAASLNSGTPVLDGVATIPVVTQARLGSDGTNYLNGHLESIEYYNERVLNAGLQVISSSAGRRSIFKPVLKTSIFA